MSNGPVIDAQFAETIRDLMARYTWALDADSPGSMDELWASGEVRFVGVTGVYTGRDAVLDVLRNWYKQGLKQHWNSNVLIKRVDDKTCEALSMSFGPKPTEDGYGVAFMGYYHDIITLENGRWRFFQRKFSWFNRDVPELASFI